MDARNFRAPANSDVSPYFKVYPLRVWSHKHFFEKIDTLDLKKSTRLWRNNLATIRKLPGSIVDKKLHHAIIKRKMADSFTLNEKKWKLAEDEVHTSSIMTSAEVLKDTFAYCQQYVKCQLDVFVTPPLSYSKVSPTTTYDSDQYEGLLPEDKFSDLQVKIFLRNTLTDLRKNMRKIYTVKMKITQSVKSVFQEYIEIANDKKLGLAEPDFVSFFHDSMFHPTLWLNTASISSKARKLANIDPSRTKQPDMISNFINNNKSIFEIIFSEIIGEGKNNNIKKNTLNIVRLGTFIKDALDNIIQNTGKCFVVFRYQTIVFIKIKEKHKHEISNLYNQINQEKEDIGKFTSWCQNTLKTPQFQKL
ncbi:2032_t:CDS:2, partial [Racocetra persica]